MAKRDKFSGIDYRLEGMSREELEDALATVRCEIIDQVQKMSEMWETLVELNRKKRRIQIRLQHLGVRMRDQ